RPDHRLRPLHRPWLPPSPRRGAAEARRRQRLLDAFPLRSPPGGERRTRPPPRLRRTERRSRQVHRQRDPFRHPSQCRPGTRHRARWPRPAVCAPPLRALSSPLRPRRRRPGSTGRRARGRRTRRPTPMKLTTTYLGLKLNNPLVVGASPFCDDVHVARELQDAGASALVMRSLFEEQVDFEQRALTHQIETPAESYAEATSYFPGFAEYQFSPDQYLRQIDRLRKSLTIPVIASLNGCRPGGWIEYARRLEGAGADGIEVNLYPLAVDPKVSAEELERDMLKTVQLV